MMKSVLDKCESASAFLLTLFRRVSCLNDEVCCLCHRSRNLAVLQREAATARKVEAAKAKVAAEASRDLAEANEEFAERSHLTLTKEEEILAAFDRANSFAADAAKARQLGRFSKGEVVIGETADSEK